MHLLPRLPSDLAATARRGAVLACASVAALTLLLALRAVCPGPFDWLRHSAYDAMQLSLPRPDAELVERGSGVVVVDLDEASLARYGQWPWRRSLVATLIERLQDAGARSIGLDLVFAEPDRTSPAKLAPLWAHDHGLTVSGDLPDYDRDLADAMRRGRVVTGYILMPGTNARSPEVANGVALLGLGAPSGLRDFGGAVPNLPLFDEAAAGQGSFSIADADADEIVRRLPLFSMLNGSLVPSLAAEAVRVAQGEDAGLALREVRGWGLLGEATGYVARIGEREIPIEPDGTVRMRFGRPPFPRTLSAARVLDDDGAPALAAAVRGRVVLIGTSALGLSDLRPTPAGPFQPGVDIHAEAIEQIMAGDVLVRPFWAPGAEARLAVLFGLAVTLVLGRSGARRGALALGLGSAAVMSGTVLAFARFDLLFDPTLVLLCGGGSFVAALAARHLSTERGARALRAAFGQYLSPQLVDALARDPGRLKLGGEEREMTFLFTDLEGFTAFAESVAPSLLVSTLNRYLDGVCALVLDHGGTIDKIVGDAVHAMFNAPLDQPDHAARAVRCALAIDGFAEGFAREAAASADIGRAFGTTRIGVNTGRAVVGNFGGRRRFDYTAHGDAINTAARLEAANKRLGTRLCVSRATVEAIGGDAELSFRPIGSLGLKGKARPVEVFAPAEASAAESRWADRYGDAFARLSGGEEDGPAAILSLLARFPDDPLLRFHAERIGRGLRGTEVALQAA